MDPEANEPDEETGKSDGYFLDDGAKVEPSHFPKPGLCIICKHDSDFKQEVICKMTRIDQRDNKEFQCEAFEKK